MAITLAAYYPALDIALSIIYLIVLTSEALNTNLRGLMAKVSVAVSLHLPGLILAVANLAKITQWDLSSYALFILQYWYIPLIPLISLVSFTTKTGIPLYHYILLGMPLLMSIYYLAVLLINDKKIRRRF